LLALDALLALDPVDALGALRAGLAGVTFIALVAFCAWDALRPDSQFYGRLTDLAVVALDLSKPADGRVQRLADLVELQVNLVAGLRRVGLQN
jgi:predicted membrane metal-binding protein